MGPHFPAKVPKSLYYTQFFSLPGFSTGSTQSTGNEPQPAEQTLGSRRRGQDDGSLHKLPQNIIYIGIHMIGIGIFKADIGLT